MALWVLWVVAFHPAHASWREFPAGLEAQAGAWGASPAPAAVPPIGREVWAPRETPPIVSDSPVVVELEPLLNRSWRSPITFQAGSRTVHVSGMKSSNGEKNWFLSLCVDPCSTAAFYKGRSILRWKPFLSPVHVLDGSATVRYDGKSFKLWIDGQLRKREESRLVVEPQDGGAKREWKVKEIADGVFAGGYPLTIGGKAYRLLYLQEILEDARGEFAGVSDERAVVFMTLANGRYEAYGIKLRDIASDRLVVFTKAPSSADDKPEPFVSADKLLRVGLRLSGSRLEVYDVLQPAARRR
ncbi:MAG: hypothetical protein HY553_06895 [Elusimicrobia bacterium]|nr:hypothetical protein [Elusimicrobiota bacterium]